MSAKYEETAMRWLTQMVRHAIEETTDRNLTSCDVANLVLRQIDPAGNETPPDLVRDAAFVTIEKIASEEMQRRRPNEK